MLIQVCDLWSNVYANKKIEKFGFTIKKILSFTSNLHNFGNAQSNTEQFLAFVVQHTARSAEFKFNIQIDVILFILVI